MEVFVLVWLSFTIGVGFLYRRCGESFWIGFCISLCCSPLIALIVLMVVLLSPANQARSRAATTRVIGSAPQPQYEGAQFYGAVNRDALEALRLADEAAAATKVAEACENCGRAIGKLETPWLYEDHVVCRECWERLKASS